MLCQSRLHTASKTFVRHKKIVSGLIFCIFAFVTSIMIRKNADTKQTNKTHTKISDS